MTVVFAAVTSLIPNATFFAELVLFAIVIGVIGRFVVPPIRAAMQRRQAEIDQARATAERDVADARRLLGQAQAEADQVLADARREGHRIRALSREVADGILSDARRRRDRTTCSPTP